MYYILDTLSQTCRESNDQIASVDLHAGPMDSIHSTNGPSKSGIHHDNKDALKEINYKDEESGIKPKGWKDASSTMILSRKACVIMLSISYVLYTERL